MLMLGVKPGDYIVIGDSIVIQAVEMENQIRLGIEAPKDISVQRGAVYEQSNPVPACIQKARKKGPRK